MTLTFRGIALASGLGLGVWVTLWCIFLFLGGVPGTLQGAEAGTADKLTVHFSRVEVWVDSGERPLAAYQVIVRASNGNPRMVGVEGGDGVFQEPPHFDPKAIQKGRVILGAYTLKDTGQLPRGRIRVATIHFQYSGAVRPEFRAILQIAASATGESLPALVFLTQPPLP